MKNHKDRLGLVPFHDCQELYLLLKNINLDFILKIQDSKDFFGHKKMFDKSKIPNS